VDLNNRADSLLLCRVVCCLVCRWVCKWVCSLVNRVVSRQDRSRQWVRRTVTASWQRDPEAPYIPLGQDPRGHCRSTSYVAVSQLNEAGWNSIRFCDNTMRLGDGLSPVTRAQGPQKALSWTSAKFSWSSDWSASGIDYCREHKGETGRRLTVVPGD